MQPVRRAKVPDNFVPAVGGNGSRKQMLPRSSIQDTQLLLQSGRQTREEPLRDFLVQIHRPLECINTPTPSHNRSSVNPSNLDGLLSVATV
jgi:hypothetical protein